MKTRTAITTAAVAALLLATSCSAGSDSGTISAPTTSTPAADDGADDKGKDTGAPSPAGEDEKPVPDFVGMGLQSAQDEAQKQGFYLLKSHDSLGRGRMQVLDRNWKVCSQNVKAGDKVPAATKLDFGAVKLEEECPAKDEQPPSADDGVMPDFAGKSVKAARQALDSGTSISVKDASPEDRMVIVGSNWQVCSQDPAPGAELKGQPVTLTAVKYEEKCP